LFGATPLGPILFQYQTYSTFLELQTPLDHKLLALRID